MKIYRIETIGSDLSLSDARDLAEKCDGNIMPMQGHADSWKSDAKYSVTVRGEFLREHHIDGKTLARLLPSWAKVKPIKGIGAKVTAFYAENDKVVTDHSICVGSDDWLIAQDDPHRAAHYHLFQKYGMYADEFDEPRADFDWRKSEFEKSKQDFHRNFRASGASVLPKS